MALPLANAIKAYRVKLPSGQTIVAGKLLQLGAVRIFYRSHAIDDAELHKWQALSFDVRLLEHIKRDAAVCIDYQTGDVLHRLMIADFERHAVQAEHNHREGQQLYVAREHWQRIVPVPYRAGWTTQEELITDGPDRRWQLIGEPERKTPPAPQQRLEL